MKKTDSSDRFSFKDFIKSRNTRRGAISIALTALFIAAVIILNLITSALSSRFSLYLDATPNTAYRLQDTTSAVASAVTKDVHIYVLSNESVFEGNGDYYVQANKLIRQFSECSSHIDLSYIDLTTNPGFTSSYPNVDWSSSHLCLLTCGDRYTAIDAEDFFDYQTDSTTYTSYISGQHIEQALSSAVYNLTADSLTNVAFLSGQAEMEMTAFRKQLTDNAYKVTDVDLLTSTIPEDSDILVIMAPSVDIDEDMAKTISAWLENGGSYGHSLVYVPTDKLSVTNFPNLNSILSDWGMSVDFGYIYESDTTYIASSRKTPLCSRYNYCESIFNETLPNSDIPVYLSYTLPITITDSDTASALLTSSESSFFGPMSDPDEDFSPDRHAYNGAAMGTKSDGATDEHSSHVIVIGSYEAFTEDFLKTNSYNNSAYFVNIFNTLTAHDSGGVIIEGKNLADSTLGEPSAAAVNLLAIVVRYIIPALVLIAGLVVWIRRRHR